MKYYLPVTSTAATYTKTPARFGVTAATDTNAVWPSIVMVPGDTRAAPSHWNTSCRLLAYRYCCLESGPASRCASRPNTETSRSRDPSGNKGFVKPSTNPRTETMLAMPSAIVNNRARANPGRRVKLLAEYRKLRSMLDNAHSHLQPEGRS